MSVCGDGTGSLVRVHGGVGAPLSEGVGAVLPVT